jgi:hypothetical protein
VTALLSAVATADNNQTVPAAPAAAQQAPAPLPMPAAQPAPPAAEAPGAPFPPQPAAVERPGFLHQLGMWWNESFGNLNAKMKDAKAKIDDLNKKSNEAAKDAAAATQEAVKNAAEATKNATSAVVRLPNTRVIDQRERCVPAPNGAPDCEAAAATLCRGKGFESGRSLDVRTSQDCPAKVLMSGRVPAEGECSEQTVLLRAICQ